MGDSGASNFQETAELVIQQTVSKPIAVEAQQFLQSMQLKPLDKTYIRNILFKYLEY